MGRGKSTQVIWARQMYQRYDESKIGAPNRSRTLEYTLRQRNLVPNFCDRKYVGAALLEHAESDQSITGV